MAAKDAVGRYGEQVAVTHLLEAGLVVLERNWYCRPSRAGGLRGELDVVALEDGWLVAVEVKTRRSLAYGHPVEAVTWAKAARLRRLVLRWLAEHPQLHPQGVRVDLVAVLRPRSGPAVVEHLRGIA